MATKLTLIFALAVVVLASGCAPGFIYTEVTSPLLKNMNDTPASGKVALTKSRGFKIPFGRLPISAQWRTDLIGEAAKANGLTTIYYADVEHVSVLGGIWQQSTVRIVGE